MNIGEMWPDILDLVTPEPRDKDPDTIWIRVAPDTLYPKMLEYLLNRMQNPVVPDPPLAELYIRAKNMQLNRQHRHILICEDARRLSPVARAVRYELLEVLRLYFTELLHRIVGGNLGLHITKDLRYKL